MRPSELRKAKREQILALVAKAGAGNVRVFDSAARGEAFKGPWSIPLLPRC